MHRKPFGDGFLAIADIHPMVVSVAFARVDQATLGVTKGEVIAVSKEAMGCDQRMGELLDFSVSQFFSGSDLSFLPTSNDGMRLGPNIRSLALEGLNYMGVSVGFSWIFHE